MNNKIICDKGIIMLMYHNKSGLKILKGSCCFLKYNVNDIEQKKQIQWKNSIQEKLDRKINRIESFQEEKRNQKFLFDKIISE